MEHVNKKLELLHLCLCKEAIPDKLPQELQKYTPDFETFKQAVQGCASSTDKIYIDALKIFRNVLLDNE